jgi:acetyl-CoA synthetase
MPTGKAFTKFVEDAGITMLGVVPSLVKAWKNSNAIDGLDWSKVKVFSSTGECSNREDMLFLMSQASYKPVIEYCGGTEIGGGFATGTVVQPAAPATFSTPALGLDLVVLDENGQPSNQGELFVVPPSIGLSVTLLNRDHHQVYFQGTPRTPDGKVLRRHGDQMELLSKGYIQAQGRADDTMNLGGIKISSAEIERVLNRVDGVIETAAIAVPPKDGGPSLLVVYVVAKPDAKQDKHEMLPTMQKQIKTQLNPLFKIYQIEFIETLPRTASNKVMRRVLRSRFGQS